MIKLFQSYFKILNHPNNKSKKFYTIIRLLWWKINQFFFKIPALVTLRGPVKILCYPDSSYGSLIFYTGYPEFYEMKFLENYLRDDSIFVDIGAGFGDYSLLAASVAKKGKIFAFEPVVKERQRLRINVELNINSFDTQIFIESLVMGSTKGVVSFTTEKISELSHIAKQTKRNSQTTILLKATTFDSFIKDKRVKKIDAVKIDVEGAELLVLKGMRDSLKKKLINLMIVEFNVNQINYDNQDFDSFAYLKECGYKVYLLKRDKLVSVKTYSGRSTQNFLIVLNQKRVMKRVKRASRLLRF